MAPCVRTLRSHLWVVLFCLGVAMLAPASAGAVSSTACNARVNDTPKKLVPCIRTGDLWSHMQAFQAIADANPGADGHPSRNSGEPGYKASVDYVADAMRKAGYDVHLQPYTFTYSSYVGTPTLSEVSPTPRSFTLISEWNPGSSQGDTPAGAQIKPAGHTVMPPSPAPSSASGCDPSDFTGFAGKVALIQRGTCNFGVKVLNATHAGAVGV